MYPAFLTASQKVIVKSLHSFASSFTPLLAAFVIVSYSKSAKTIGILYGFITSKHFLALACTSEAFVAYINQ